MSYLFSPRPFDEESGSSTKNEGSSYFVYARIQPLDVRQVSDALNQKQFKVTGKEIITNHLNKKNELLESKYKFYQVFMPSTPQSQIFRDVVHPRWVEFLNGKDSLIFSYGATNSGKSFTMQGTSSQPGIISRTLFATFRAIATQEDVNCTLRPLFSCQAFCPTEEEKALWFASKKSVLSQVAAAKHKSSDMSIFAVSTPDMTKILSDMKIESPTLQPGLVYSVWISFVEVYNEKVFDLLAPDQNKLDTNLKLKRDDGDMCFYPDGASQHLSCTWEEAYNLYRYGIKNLHIASTCLNRNSSRSHSVFTIKLLSRSLLSEGTYNFVSSLSICDLAGTERMAHTEHEGPSRVRELLNINTSLLALNRCFIMLLSAQRHPTREPVVPYRDSKLTMLFSKFLLGKGKLSMIANISQENSMFFLTEQVLKTTSVASETRTKIKVDAGPKKALKKRFSVAYSGNINAQSTPLAPPQHPISQDDVLRHKNEELQQANTLLKLENAALLRKCDDVQERLVALQSTHLEKMEELEQQLHAESSFAVRATHGVRELQEALRKKRREFNEMQFKWPERLTAAIQKRDQLCAHVQSNFDLMDVTDPVMIIKKACFIHNDMKKAAKEEIAALEDEISSLHETLAKRDDEISLLKGKIVDLEEQGAFLEAYDTIMSIETSSIQVNEADCHPLENRKAPRVDHSGENFAALDV